MPLFSTKKLNLKAQNPFTFRAIPSKKASVRAILVEIERLPRSRWRRSVTTVSILENKTKDCQVRGTSKYNNEVTCRSAQCVQPRHQPCQSECLVYLSIVSNRVHCERSRCVRGCGSPSRHGEFLVAKRNVSR